MHCEIKKQSLFQGGWRQRTINLEGQENMHFNQRERSKQEKQVGHSGDWLCSQLAPNPQVSVSIDILTKASDPTTLGPSQCSTAQRLCLLSGSQI